jgi:hypothetical protein
MDNFQLDQQSIKAIHDGLTKVKTLSMLKESATKGIIPCEFAYFNWDSTYSKNILNFQKDGTWIADTTIQQDVIDQSGNQVQCHFDLCCFVNGQWWRIASPIYWAVATQNAVSGYSGNYQVQANPCNLENGSGTDTSTTLTILLPKHGGSGFSADTKSGEVLAITQVTGWSGYSGYSGQYVAVSDYSTRNDFLNINALYNFSPTYWGVVKYDVLSTDTTCTINTCSNSAGADPNGAVTLTIKLPKHSNSVPDLKANDVIAYTQAFNKEYVAQSDYTGVSGYSGYGSSGYSGVSVSGYSGISGYSGVTGSSVSGYSGISGYSGKSGYSGLGISGYSGYSGMGYSGCFLLDITFGASGYWKYFWCGTSGYSGYTAGTTC